jgi:ABC-type branched-chain amino acid transport systems, periplasmic component
MTEAVMKRRMILASIAAMAVAIAGPAMAQKKYDPGASDTEIKIGNINPYSGPASAYGQIGRAIAAYFKKVNAGRRHQRPQDRFHLL